MITVLSLLADKDLAVPRGNKEQRLHKAAAVQKGRLQHSGCCPSANHPCCVLALLFY